MKKEIADYFLKLEDKQLPRKNGSLLFDDTQIRYSSENMTSLSGDIILTIDNIPFYTKLNNRELSLSEVASSNMYNAIGITTPPVYLINNPSKYRRLVEGTHLINQSLYSIDKYEFKPAHNVIGESTLDMFKGKWDAVRQTSVKHTFLKLMTQECFDNLIGLALVDELRTEKDRHIFNYFFYRRPGKRKFEGVIPIDNELMEVMNHSIQTKDDFLTFLKHRYWAYSPISVSGFSTYLDKTRQIKDLLQEDRLTPKQIELMKKALSYDLPREFFESGSNPDLKMYRASSYDKVSQLWEFNQNDMGRELGL